MKLLLDTSVLVAGMVEAHPEHERALVWLERVRNTDNGFISAHSLAEVYAVLTRLPVQPKIHPEIVVNLLQRNIFPYFTIVELTQEDYFNAIQNLAKARLVGGIVYDALIMQTAIKAGVEQLITLNAKDFRRLYPNSEIAIVEP
ncbi:Ribonuclease VapC [Gammaproteobacteria bacterium]